MDQHVIHTLTNHHAYGMIWIDRLCHAAMYSAARRIVVKAVTCVRDICWAHDTTDLLHAVQIR